MKIKNSDKFIDALLCFIFSIVVFFFNPVLYSKLTGYYFINEIVHGVIFFLGIIALGNFYIRTLVEKHKDIAFYLINFDFLKSKKLRKELTFIKRAHSRLERKSIATLLHSHNAVKTPNRRIRFDYDSVCVQRTVRADKLYKEESFRQDIAKGIADKLKKTTVDIIISSKTAANEMLSSTIMESIGAKGYYFYNLSSESGINLISSPDLRSFKTINSSKIDILAVETTMLTPKVIHVLEQFIETLAEETEKAVRLVGIAVVFNGYKESSRRAFSGIGCDCVFDLFEVNMNLLPVSDCPNCYIGDCRMDNFIEKNYIIPYA